MATCITKARSNYFSVTDVPAFLTMMQKWEKDFGIRIMKKRIDEDQTVYAFSYETTSVNINGALCYLQKFLPEWEAVIIQEIAYEQSLNGMMRYVIPPTPWTFPCLHYKEPVKYLQTQTLTQ